MPASQPAPPPPPEGAHHARRIAESFGTDAERYERTRPTYPPAMVDALLAVLPGHDVLDVGVGTGISARPFQSRGCRVLGIEPDARMADVARSAGLDVDISTFETWDPVGRSFDLLIAGQAWHWVDPDVGAAKAAMVLRSGGRIALFWNVMSFSADFAAGSSAVYRRVLPDVPFLRNGTPGGMASYAPLLDAAVSGLRASGAFGEPERWQFDWDRTYPRDEWLEQVPTFGGHSLVPSDQLAELLDGIGTVIDASGGDVTVGYTTVVLTSVRVG